MITMIKAPLNPKWDADGFLGIGPPLFVFEDSVDTLSVFLSAFEKPSLTFYYARYVTKCKNETDKCKFEWYPAIITGS